jgi:hypothetical protein
MSQKNTLFSIRHWTHCKLSCLNTATGLHAVLDTIYRPRNLFLVGPLTILTAITINNWLSEKQGMNDDTSSSHRGSGTNKSSSSSSLSSNQVQAWWNARTSQWEQPAPWDPDYQAYRKQHPQLPYIARNQVQTRHVQ